MYPSLPFGVKSLSIPTAFLPKTTELFYKNLSPLGYKPTPQLPSQGPPSSTLTAPSCSCGAPRQAARSAPSGAPPRLTDQSVNTFYPLAAAQVTQKKWRRSTGIPACMAPGLQLQGGELLHASCVPAAAAAAGGGCLRRRPAGKYEGLRSLEAGRGEGLPSGFPASACPLAACCLDRVCCLLPSAFLRPPDARQRHRRLYARRGHVYAKGVQVSHGSLLSVVLRHK